MRVSSGKGGTLMGSQELERRVAAVEQELARLKATLVNGKEIKPWHYAPFVEGDKQAAKAIELATEHRSKDRERARRRAKPAGARLTRKPKKVVQ